MGHQRQLKLQTRALLTGLGTGPDEVAESLLAAGVSGVPMDNRRCAVALYVSALMGGDPRVRSVNVGRCSLLLDTAAPPEFHPSGRLLVQLPKPVRQFVAAFDTRHYPEVIRIRTGGSRAGSSLGAGGADEVAATAPSSR
jgi:hypothetical protein